MNTENINPHTTGGHQSQRDDSKAILLQLHQQQTTSHHRASLHAQYEQIALKSFAQGPASVARSLLSSSSSHQQEECMDRSQRLGNKMEEREDEGEYSEHASTHYISQNEDYDCSFGGDGRPFSEHDVVQLVHKRGNVKVSYGLDWRRLASLSFTMLLCFVAFISPVVMIALPQIPFVEWNSEAQQCDVKCEGQLLTVAFKSLILLLATWALFFRRARDAMPGISIFRGLVLFLVFIIILAFWLFYGTRMLKKRDEPYSAVVGYTVKVVDALLFVHYLSLLLLEIRHLETRFALKVLRSPDGVSRYYLLGEMPIQQAVIHVLQNYVANFPMYNRYLHDEATRYHSRKTRAAQHTMSTSQCSSHNSSRSFKMYDMNHVPSGESDLTPSSHLRMVVATNAVDRFNDEFEFEQRVHKCIVRLHLAAEEAFTHIRFMGHERTSTKSMRPREAAEAVFPALMKPLQKYLRITRQQSYHSMDMILAHLATCISHNLSPRAFVERFLPNKVVIENTKTCKPRQGWILQCRRALQRSLEDNVEFILRNNDVTLLCTVRKLTFFSVAEEMIDLKRNRFVFQMNSETSV